MVDYSAPKRSIAQYEIRIAELKEEVSRTRNKCETTEKRLENERSFRVAHADMKRGTVETVIGFAFATALSGLGALLMGVYPRILVPVPAPPDTTPLVPTPPQFWIGATLVFIGVVLGIIYRPAIQFLCHKWPKFSNPTKPTISD